MKYFIYIFLSLTIFSCVSIKETYTKGELNTNDRSIKQLFEKFDAGSKDKSIVIFTAWFEKDTIKIKNGEKIIFNRVVNTSPQLSLGGFNTIDNTETVEVQIYTPKLIKLLLNSENLKKYKFAYISRDVLKRKKYTIEYSNEWKKFM